MNCREAEELIHGFSDNELDLVWTLQMERDIHQCPSCSGIYQTVRAVRTALSDNSPYFQPQLGSRNVCERVYGK